MLRHQPFRTKDGGEYLWASVRHIILLIFFNIKSSVGRKSLCDETKPYLLDDINGIMELLPLQEGVQVVHQVEEVPLSAAVGDENRHALPRDAVWGLVHTLCHAFVFPLHILEFQRGLKGQLQGSLYTKGTTENES